MYEIDANIRRNWGWHAGVNARRTARHEPWVRCGQSSGHPCDKPYGEGYWAGYWGLESPSRYDPHTGKVVKRDAK